MSIRSIQLRYGDEFRSLRIDEKNLLGVVEPKTRSRQYVMIEDIFPTFLEMAGVTDYKQIGGPIDGVSFVPLLRQQAADYP